jgi:sulfatase maturation enzyme AslB (radical SAM superfamily)
MELTNLTFIVTDDCNFQCSYCFQKKKKEIMEDFIIKKALNFFYPYFRSDKKNQVGFYGGEPLLAYDRIGYTVQLLSKINSSEKKEVGYFITTNGSLLTRAMLEFFDRHRFGLMLSFDGLAQEEGRPRGTFRQTVELMESIRDYPGIAFEINSVFTPRTVSLFFESLRFIIEKGGPIVTFNLSTMERWEPADLNILESQLEQLSDYLVQYYIRERRIPVKNFHPSRQGIFRCNAGHDHIAITPDGQVWGCFLFYDYFKSREEDPQYGNYAFGTLNRLHESREQDYEEVYKNYSQLRQDFFQVDREEASYCFLCKELEGCVVCPVNAAYTSGALGKISRGHCRLIRLQSAARREFNRMVQNS